VAYIGRAKRRAPFIKALCENKVGMKGTYQHRIFFVYFDLFTIEDGGVRVKEKLYPWCDLKAFREVPQQGVAFLILKNKKRLIQSRRFRRKGSALTLTFMGKNETYENFRSFIWAKILENEKSPEYKRLQIMHDKLVSQIEDTTDESKIVSLVSDYKVCVSQLNHLNQQELTKMGSKSKKMILQTALLMIVVLGSIIWASIA